MDAADAIEIRERAKRLGLKTCCPECAEDIALLENLSDKYGIRIIPPSLPIAVEASLAKAPVLGRALEDAARRLRRSIGAAA